MCPRGSTVLGGHADFEVTAAAQRKLAKRHVGPQVSHCDFASAKSQTARTVFGVPTRFVQNCTLREATEPSPLLRSSMR